MVKEDTALHCKSHCLSKKNQFKEFDWFTLTDKSTVDISLTEIEINVI